MRKQLLKFLIILLVLLSASFGLIWLWSWYTFNIQWQIRPLEAVSGEKSAVSMGIIAGLFILSTLILVIVNYRVIKNS